MRDSGVARSQAALRYPCGQHFPSRLSMEYLEMIAKKTLSLAVVAAVASLALAQWARAVAGRAAR